MASAVHFTVCFPQEALGFLGLELSAMTTTKGIHVSGEDFINRRILVCRQQGSAANLQERAYDRGYNRGSLCGFLIGVAITVIVVFCVWLML